MTWPTTYDEYVLQRTVRPTDLLGTVGSVNHATLHNDVGTTLDALQQIVGLDTNNEWQNGRWQGVSLLQMQKDLKTGKTTVLNHIGKSDLAAGARQTLSTQVGYGFTTGGTTFTSQLTVIPDQAAGIQVKFETLAGKIIWAGGPTISATAAQLAVDKPVQVAKGTADAHAARVDQTVPIGAIIAWGGTVANIPSGWQLCDSSACRSPELSTAIGRSTVPDLRDRFILGAGPNHAKGTTGGEEAHTLTLGEMPAHGHQLDGVGDHSHVVHGGGNHKHGVEVYQTQRAGASGTWNWDLVATRGGNPIGNTNWSGDHVHGMGGAGGHGHTLHTTGGSQPHNNMPPFYVLVYIIKFSH